MKTAFVALLNKPLLVVIASLAIAGVADATFYRSQQETRVWASAMQSADAPQEASSTILSEGGHLTLGFLASGRVQQVKVNVGDTVHRGEVLASLDPENTSGAITQARAAYDAAQAAYEKVVNGATGSAVDVSKAAVSTAQTNLDATEHQQDALVANAKRKLYTDGLVAISDTEARRAVVPTISGTYDGDAGQYAIYFHDINDISNWHQARYSGIESGTVMMSDLPQPLGNNGLLITFPTTQSYYGDDRWTIDIPNKNGANYTANLNAYQAAVKTRDQAVATAQAALDQAKAALALTVAQARPEDVAAAKAQVESARGALQIAQSAYSSRIITAPQDGTVSAVHISAGQIATANTAAIELTASTNEYE